MKLGIKFNKNTLLSIVFAILLVVFALWLVKRLDKTGREGEATRPLNTIQTKIVAGGIKKYTT
jgi:flagellar biogenesis protein FliO